MLKFVVKSQIFRPKHHIQQHITNTKISKKTFKCDKMSFLFCVWNIRSDSCAGCLLLSLLGGDEVVHDVDGHGEDDGGVVLRRDRAQRLEVAELPSSGCISAVHDYVQR